jgi:glycosyltransferase involved in cell wall biosynthesis
MIPAGVRYRGMNEVPMSKLLTVAVPSDNAARFLNKNIESLMAVAGRERLDVIIVDDGSTDETGAMADALAKQYDGIVRVIHKENGGHGSGVNAGLKKALGTYYCVLDADDYVDPHTFGKVLNRLERCEPVALALFDFDFVDEDGQVTKHVELPALPKDQVFSFGDYAGKLHDGPDRWVWIHNAIYRREFLEKIDFSCHEHHYYVDMEYITYPLTSVGNAVYFPLRARYYLVGRGGQSVALNSRVKHFDQYREVVEFLVAFDRKEAERSASTGTPNAAVLAYTRSRTAEFITGVYSTLFGFPDRKDAVRVATEFDEWLRKEAPEIYEANESLAVKALRTFRFSLMGVGAFVYRILRGKT